MKAILVLEMPESCECCPFCKGWNVCKIMKYLKGEKIMSIYTLDRQIFEGGKPDWCPLKPMPERANHPDCCDNGRFDAGWNDCLDAIEEQKMTENEAIGVLKYLNFCGLCTTGPCGNCERKQAKDAALSALEEIQQYRAIGTVEEINQMKRYFHLAKKHDTIGKVIDACAEYEQIGTPDQLRAAMDKQTPAAPQVGQHYYICPRCGVRRNIASRQEYCGSCGQRMMWE